LAVAVSSKTLILVGVLCVLCVSVVKKGVLQKSIIDLDKYGFILYILVDSGRRM
jgi:hypothetical protein